MPCGVMTQGTPRFCHWKALTAKRGDQRPCTWTQSGRRGALSSDPRLTCMPKSLNSRANSRVATSIPPARLEGLNSSKWTCISAPRLRGRHPRIVEQSHERNIWRGKGLARSGWSRWNDVVALRMAKTPSGVWSGSKSAQFVMEHIWPCLPFLRDELGGELTS